MNANNARMYTPARLLALLEEASRDLEHLAPDVERLHREVLPQIKMLAELQQRYANLVQVQHSLAQQLAQSGEPHCLEPHQLPNPKALEPLAPSVPITLRPVLGLALTKGNGREWQKQILAPYPQLVASLRHQEATSNPKAAVLPRHSEGVFVPEQAFDYANQVLKRNTSINYQLFSALVLNGGQASNAQMKQYLLDNKVLQPGTSQGFEDVSLSSIASRVAYLVRKGLVQPLRPGHFVCTVGWVPVA
jgi:hypothetical protein